MMNPLSVAWKLSLYQIWNPKRRWITLALLLFPLIIVAAAAIFGDAEKREFYQGFVTVAVGSIMLPFIALYWGSGALSDEIEGKTLVYLWTRPQHRGLLIFGKIAGSWLWLVLIALIACGAAFIYAYSNPQMLQMGGLADNLLVVLWDWRALSLAAIAYSALGFLLSVTTNRPLTYGLLIAYMWELVPAYGPGFFKHLSITQQMLALATHKVEDSGNLVTQMIQQESVTENQALATLIGIIIIFVCAGIWLTGRKEFLSDDPARNQ